MRGKDEQQLDVFSYISPEQVSRRFIFGPASRSRGFEMLCAPVSLRVCGSPPRPPRGLKAHQMQMAREGPGMNDDRGSVAMACYKREETLAWAVYNAVGRTNARN
jgi:hypothetical protein